MWGEGIEHGFRHPCRPFPSASSWSSRGPCRHGCRRPSCQQRWQKIQPFRERQPPHMSISAFALEQCIRRLVLFPTSCHGRHSFMCRFDCGQTRLCTACFPNIVPVSSFGDRTRIPVVIASLWACLCAYLIPRFCVCMHLCFRCTGRIAATVQARRAARARRPCDLAEARLPASMLRLLLREFRLEGV